LSPEVWAFAEEKGAAAYLPAVLEMTRRVFPTAPLKVFVEEDPEIADERSIVFEVIVPELDGEQLLAAHDRWHSGLFQHCPPTHVCLFCLGLVAVP
jgi:hypothetical protein